MPGVSPGRTLRDEEIRALVRHIQALVIGHLRRRGFLDDDGDFDVVTSNPSFGNNSGGELVISTQVALGKFAKDARVLTGDINPGTIATADMNADGRMDIVHDGAAGFPAPVGFGCMYRGVQTRIGIFLRRDCPY